MTGPAGTDRGLSAVELAAAASELQPLCGAFVLDVNPITSAPATSDLLLVLQRGDERKQFVLIALGSDRAHVTTTARRFHKDDVGKGPGRDLLQQHLHGAELTAVTATAGERRCEFMFDTRMGKRRLVAELFSARGLWALLDDEDLVVTMSRPVETAVRTLRVGDRYLAPPTRGGPRSPPPVRFSVPVLQAIDELFTAQDGASATGNEHEQLLRATERALKKASARDAGLTRQLEAADSTHELRTRADLMLAYAHAVVRGASDMTVPHPETGEPWTIDLDPSRPVHVQAHALYDKARRLTDGRAITEQRKAEAEAIAAALDDTLARVRAIEPGSDDAMDRLAAVRAELQALGALPKVRPTRTKPKAGRTAPIGENFRRFVSAEGYQILVGRNNQQNDRLTMRVAKGNDLWLHVGGGRAGSHVVIRLPKQKTASLETLLDAATLAVHFSKARGERRIDVIYTHRKHVKKPKGLPAGAVVPSQTKTVAVDLEPERLRRLLDSAADDADRG